MIHLRRRCGYIRPRPQADVAAPSAQMDHLLHLLLFRGLCYIHNEIIASNFTDLDTGTRFVVDATQGVRTAKQYDARAVRTSRRVAPHLELASRLAGARARLREHGKAASWQHGRAITWDTFNPTF